MARRQAERLDALIPTVLKRVEAQHSALRAIQQRWGKLVGRELAAHTKPISLRRGRLVVRADQPGDGFVLSYQRAQLLKRLGAAAPGRVEEIIIRPGA